MFWQKKEEFFERQKKLICCKLKTNKQFAHKDSHNYVIL